MTHPAAELLRAIADGKQMEIRMANGEWWKCMAAQALQTIAENGEEDVRIVRPMVTRTVTYPEPLRVKPEHGGEYWTVFPYNASSSLRVWIGDDFDCLIFAAGMAFATEADAAEAHKALFGAQA